MIYAATPHVLTPVCVDIPPHTHQWPVSLYHSFNETNAWLDTVVAEHGDIAELFDIGTSYEGRPIRGVRLTGTEYVDQEWLMVCPLTFLTLVTCTAWVMLL